MNRRGVIRAIIACLAVVAASGTSLADGPAPLRIGVLVDMSGTTSDLGGRGSVVAAQLAVDDNGADVLGRRVEIVPGDTQSKPDVAVNLARRWFDEEGVDAIADLPNAAIAVQAGDYSAVNHYLKAVKAAGTVDGPTVAARMKAMPVEDFMTHGAAIRPDGRVVRDMYLAQVKTPAQSKGEWDVYAIQQTLPGAGLLPPPSETACPTAR